MTNILLRRANHFGYLPKVVILNEKNMRSFSIQQYTNPLVSTRATLQSTDANKNAINIKFDDISTDILIHKWTKKNEIEEIIDLIQASHHINSYQVLSLLKWCNNVADCTPLDKVKLMESLWINLTVCNFQLNTSHYNAILKLYMDNNYDFSPSDFLAEMRNKDIDLDDISYQICFNYYCTKGEIDKAVLLLESHHCRFPLYSISPVFHSLLMGYSQLGNIEYVNKILNSMTSKNIKLTSTSYTAVMCAYAKLNDINKIKKVIETCYSNYLYFTNENILEVIYVLALNNHIKHINVMYQYLKKVFYISNEEVRLILKLLNINQVNIAINAFLRMILNNDKWSRYENVMQIILKYVVDKSTVRKRCACVYFLVSVRLILHSICFQTPDQMMRICNYFKYNTKIYKKLLSLSLYYSLLNNELLSLHLLREYKSYSTIKPHYFWPLLIRKATKYDHHGILNILRIMVNEFNIFPCIETITDYVLPTCFENLIDTRNLLMKYNVHKTIFDNSWVLLNLKKRRMSQAASYIQSNPGPYFYKELVHELRHASIFRNDAQSFVYISCKLLEDTSNAKYTLTTLGNNAHGFVPVPLDKQLHDMMIDFPSEKAWLKKVIAYLANEGIRLKHETMGMINNFLTGFVVDDVIHSNKMGRIYKQTNY